MRVTLEDGRVVGGLLGYDSLAGYSQQSQDLFLEERWELDEEQWFTKRAPGTLGLWLSSEHLVSLEFYELPSPELPSPELPSPEGQGEGGKEDERPSTTPAEDKTQPVMPDVDAGKS